MLKCTKFDVASQTPLGELTQLPHSPDSLAGFMGAYFLWQREEGKERA